jgi:hypothetical protein
MGGYRDRQNGRDILILLAPPESDAKAGGQREVDAASDR